MQGELTFKSSGDIGDTIYQLCSMKCMGGGSIYLNPKGLPDRKYNGEISGLNPTSVAMLQPLLEFQSYISSVQSWNGQDVDVDLDEFRHYGIRLHKYNLCQTVLRVNRLPQDEMNRPWLEVEPHKIAATVFARSPRYQNQKVNWQVLWNEYKDAVFVGLKHEHEMFEEEVGRVPYYLCHTFKEMAEVIRGAERLVGNQSAPMAFALAMGQAVLQEVCTESPNCIFQRNNCGYMFGD